MKIIEIVVSPTGQSVIQTKGFSGSTCRDATRELEKALGAIQSDQPTAEMYQSATSQEPARHTIGG